MMIVKFDGETLYQAKDIISNTKEVPVIIKDDVEGDIHLTIILIEDGGDCFTKYVVENSHKAEVRIFNAPKLQFVRLLEPIKIGTYKHSSFIKMEYVLEPCGADKTRIIKVIFSLSKD